MTEGDGLPSDAVQIEGLRLLQARVFEVHRVRTFITARLGDVVELEGPRSTKWSYNVVFVTGTYDGWKRKNEPARIAPPGHPFAGLIWEDQHLERPDMTLDEAVSWLGEVRQRVQRPGVR